MMKSDFPARKSRASAGRTRDADARLDRLDREEGRAPRRASSKAEGDLRCAELARRLDEERARFGRLAPRGWEVSDVRDLEDGVGSRPRREGHGVRGMRAIPPGRRAEVPTGDRRDTRESEQAAAVARDVGELERVVGRAGGRAAFADVDPDGEN